MLKQVVSIIGYSYLLSVEIVLFQLKFTLGEGEAAVPVSPINKFSALFLLAKSGGDEKRIWLIAIVTIDESL